MTGADRLKSAVGRWRRPPTEPDDWTVRPSSAFEVAVAEQIKAIRSDLDRVATRLNWLLGIIIAAALGNIILSLFR